MNQQTVTRDLKTLAGGGGLLVLEKKRTKSQIGHLFDVIISCVICFHGELSALKKSWGSNSNHGELRKNLWGGI